MADFEGLKESITELKNEFKTTASTLFKKFDILVEKHGKTQEEQARQGVEIVNLKQGHRTLTAKIWAVLLALFGGVVAWIVDFSKGGN